MYKNQLLQLLIFIAFTLTSCDKEISEHSETESHNAGMDCMQCHTSGEDNFHTAGTVFDTSMTSPLANAVIKLYSEPMEGGKLKASIEVDGLGNFFSSKKLNFSNGLYPTVIGPGGNKKHMSSSTTSGSCNSCHGISQDPIWVN